MDNLKHIGYFQTRITRTGVIELGTFDSELDECQEWCDECNQKARNKWRPAKAFKDEVTRRTFVEVNGKKYEVA